MFNMFQKRLCMLFFNNFLTKITDGERWDGEEGPACAYSGIY